MNKTILILTALGFYVYQRVLTVYVKASSDRQ
jgi:hypothetical protein